MYLSTNQAAAMADHGTAFLTKAFGSKKDIDKLCGYTGASGSDYTVIVRPDAAGHYVYVSVGNNMFTLLSFTVSTALNCCGLRQVHGFQHRNVPEKLVHQLLDFIFLDPTIFNRMGAYSHRIIAACVQYGDESTGRGEDSDDYDVDEYLDKDWGEGNGERFEYPYMHSWLLKQRKCSTRSVMWNCNSCNLVHLMEVIL